MIKDLDTNGQGYVEVLTQSHKTAKCAAVKSRLLPVVAPTQGVCGSQWSDALFELRERCGLPQKVDIVGPLFPAPTRDGSGFTNRPLRSSEVTAWLRMILSRAPGHDRGSHEEKHITSHSLKHTPLSWCSKFGLDDPTCNILGRHLTITSQKIYAREVLASPLRKFEKVLVCIQRKTFKPDETRSGFFARSLEDEKVEATEEIPSVQSVPEVSASVEQPEVEGERSPGSGSSASEVSEEESVGSEDDQETDPNVAQAKLKAAPGDYTRFAHIRSGIVHVATSQLAATFTCGRKLTESYAPVDSSKDSIWVTCKGCFKPRVLDGERCVSPVAANLRLQDKQDRSELTACVALLCDLTWLAVC